MAKWYHDSTRQNREPGAIWMHLRGARGEGMVVTIVKYSVKGLAGCSREGSNAHSDLVNENFSAIQTELPSVHMVFVSTFTHEKRGEAPS